MIVSVAISARTRNGSIHMTSASVRAISKDEAIGRATTWIKEYWLVSDGYYDYRIHVSEVPDEWLQSPDPIQ